MDAKIKIAVIGLGYVGLPLARLFATKYPVVGYDINANRVAEVQQGIDSTLELDAQTLKDVLVKAPSFEKGLFCSTDTTDIEDCTYFIITMPTPVDKNNTPVLTHLLAASKTVGGVLKKGATVIYESTVYPGATEEDCVPLLEKVSGLVYNKDFFAGYSPERINPGDKINTIDKILKITSGSTIETAQRVDALYGSVITAGTYLAPSIKVAEAAKVIENTQRDVNIAFVNELAKIFNLMDINIHEVLKAAGTKWNFLPFKPGLVGGHCIGVDPYYLAHKAQEYGYHPEMILAGRRVNDSMGAFVAAEVAKLMIKKGVEVKDAAVLVLGITFKENCSDVRNTKAVDVVNELTDFGTKVTIYDPCANPEQVKNEYNLVSQRTVPKEKYDAIVLTVSHAEFKNLDLKSLKKEHSVVYDVKNFLNPKEVNKSL